MAEKHEETYHRHGKPDASKWAEAEAVTDRAPDVAPENTSFADRAKARSGNKAVQAAEAKDVDDEKPVAKKAPAPKKSKKDD